MIAVKWVKDAARGRPCAETAAPGCVQPATAPLGCAHSLLPRTGQEMPQAGGALSARG
jgi:hypothetical protein